MPRKSKEELAMIAEGMANAALRTEDPPELKDGVKPKKGAGVIYLIVAVDSSTKLHHIIGMRPTRGQCKRQFDALRQLMGQMYKEVYVVKGKKMTVESL